MTRYFIKEVFGILSLLTVSPARCQHIPHFCETDGSIDTITRTHHGETYAFKGDWYWQIDYNRTAQGYPRQIAKDWNGLPGDLDASFTMRYGSTYFFKGENCWRFINKEKVEGYPKPIYKEFKGIPDHVDAALVWSGNGKVYFFKGYKYWRYDFDAPTRVSSSYPASITKWKGLPEDRVDAAFVWENNVSYFFKDGQYYRYDDQTATASHPVSTASAWFSCPTTRR